MGKFPFVMIFWIYNVIAFVVVYSTLTGQVVRVCFELKTTRPAGSSVVELQLWVMNVFLCSLGWEWVDRQAGYNAECRQRRLWI